MRFSQLLEEWKAFHFLSVDHSTRQTYERRLPALEAFLMNVPVEAIVSRVIDQMIMFWKSDEFPKGKARHSFEKELDALKVILNFYRRRRDPRFAIQIYREHYTASRVRLIADQGVRSLSPMEL